MKPMHDNSHELIVCRYRNGIKLLRPDDSLITLPFVKSTGLTVEDILSLPFCTYFSDVTTLNLHINDPTVIACGFNSTKSAENKTLHEVMDRKSVERIVQSNMNVMETHKQRIEEYVSKRKDDIDVATLSIRSPWYDRDDKLIGIFGCTAVLGQHPLSEMISTIANLGIIATNNYYVNETGKEINHIYFTRRELECIQLTLLGKSAKQIAFQLNISRRTVERHLENIKVKTNSKTKSDMIIKLMNFF